MKCERIHDLTVVTFLEQELKPYPTFQRVADELTRRIDAGCRKLLVDLRNVEWISSVFVGLFVLLEGRMRELGGTFALCEVRSPYVAETIELMHVDFCVFDARQDAVETLRRS